MEQLLPTRFLHMFKSMNITKEPITWKIEECNSQIVVTLIWDSLEEGKGDFKADVLNVSTPTGSKTLDAADQQAEVSKHVSRNMAEKGKASITKSEDIDLEIVEVDTDEDIDKLPKLLREASPQFKTEILIDSQDSDDTVIILDENGNQEVSQPAAVSKLNKCSPSEDLPSQPCDDMASCGRRPHILRNRHEPLTEEEIKRELQLFTLSLRSDNMGRPTRKMPLEHYVEIHRQKIIMLNNWFLCRKAEGKSTNCYPNKNKRCRKRNRKVSKRSKQWNNDQRFSRRPNFLRHAKLPLTVEEVKHEVEKYRAEFAQKNSTGPMGLPVEYYVGKYILRINRLNRWYADKKKWEEENGHGVWWKAPTLQVDSPDGTNTLSWVTADTSTKTAENLDPVVEMCEIPSDKDYVTNCSNMEAVPPVTDAL